MSGSLNQRLKRLEQHMPGPDRPWRADDYARWRQQHIDAGDPEGPHGGTRVPPCGRGKLSAA